MRSAKVAFTASLVASALLFPVGSASAEEFDWIMASISKLKGVDNGDGHQWAFKKSAGGKWKVEGANFETATASSAGNNKVSIEGFPFEWGANGTYVFKRETGTCSLKSQQSATHHLKWPC